MKLESLALAVLLMAVCIWNPTNAQYLKCTGALDLACDRNTSTNCEDPPLNSCEECCIRPGEVSGGNCYKTDPFWKQFCDKNYLTCSSIPDPEIPLVYCLPGVNGHDDLCFNQFTQACLAGRVCDGPDPQFCSPVPPHGPGGCYKASSQVCLSGIVCDGIDAGLCRANGQFAEGVCYHTTNQTCNYVGQDLKPVICDGFNSSYCPPDPNNPIKFPGRCYDHTTQSCDNGHVCNGTGMRLCTEHTTPYIGECYNTSTHICYGRKVCQLDEKLCEPGVNGGVAPGVCITNAKICYQGALCDVGMHFCSGLNGTAGECFNPRLQGCFNGSTCFLGRDCFVDEWPTPPPTVAPTAGPTNAPTGSQNCTIIVNPAPTATTPLGPVDTGSNTDYRMIFIIFCALLIIFIFAALVGIIIKCVWTTHLKSKRGRPLTESVEIRQLQPVVVESQVVQGRPIEQ